MKSKPLSQILADCQSRQRRLELSERERYSSGERGVNTERAKPVVRQAARRRAIEDN